MSHSFPTRRSSDLRSQKTADAAEIRQWLLGERLGIAPGNSEGEEIFYQFVIEQRIRPAIEQATTQPLAVAYSVMLLFSAGFYVVHGRTAKHIIIEAQCECRHAAARCLFVSGIISGSETLFSPWQCGAAQACVEPQ